MDFYRNFDEKSETYPQVYTVFRRLQVAFIYFNLFYVNRVYFEIPRRNVTNNDKILKKAGE